MALFFRRHISDQMFSRTFDSENRLDARSLEGAWEQRLRQQEAVDQEYRAWQSEQVGPLSNGERAEVLKLAKDFSRVRQIATRSSTKGLYVWSSVR